MHTAQPRQYIPAPRPAPVSEWLNPRLRRYVEAMRDHLLLFYQWKIIVDHDEYDRLAQVACLPDANAATDAIQGLFRLGCLELRARGDSDALQLLDPNIDRWAGKAGRVAL